MKISWEEFKNRFPNLAREMEDYVQAVRISSIRSYEAEEFDELRMPDAVSYLRCCETEEQPEEMIDYLQRKGEATLEYANSLRRQLREKGVRSFGLLKKLNYHLHRYYKKRL